MATSESSSAVLELNDADTDDAEATTMTDDTHDGIPLIMEHGYDIAVKVDAPMKQLSTLETYVTYRVRCVCARWQTPTHVRRRYNHFKLLHKRLSTSHPLVASPPLPPLHSARQQLDRYSPAFVAIRTCGLNAFLDRVAKHPILTHSDDFRIFLTTADDELDKVFKSENSALNLWGLSSALYGTGDTKPANGPRVKDPEFSSAADYLQSLQQKLTTLCTLTTKLHKSTVSLGNEYMGMKRACDHWSVSGRALEGRGCSALARAARAAHAALSAGGARGGAARRAQLPLLAHYAGAQLDKIKQRDAVHAAYVSGSNSNDELHNRLEQASEALRSDLSDWYPKTHSEIKSILLDLADRQVNIHRQTLQGWEQALKMATESNIEEIFKTVSKTAIQNLSPSKCRSEVSPTETVKDFDDISDDNDDFDVYHVKNGSDQNPCESDDCVVNNGDSDMNGSDEKMNVTELNNSDGSGTSKCSKFLENNSVDLCVENKTEDGVLSEILEEQADSKNVCTINNDKLSDPLTDFADIDLS